MRLPAQQGRPAEQGTVAAAGGFPGLAHDFGRFGGDAQRGQAVAAAFLDQHAADCGVEVHVLVRVGVVQAQAGGGEGCVLGGDLGPQLAADARVEEVAHAQSRLVGWELAVRADQAGDLGRRQDGGTFNHDQMQAHVKVRQALGYGHCFGCRGAGDHQAGGGQNAVAVRPLDRFVDRWREAEIVGADDDLVRQPCCGPA